MSENSLKGAVLGRLANDDEPPPKKPKAIKTKPAKDSIEGKKAAKPSRANKVLIGGHFPPEVNKQLRLIAAEEGTTNQELLEEALNLLFVKKGKALIKDL